MLEYATSKVKLWPACLCPSSQVDRYHLAAAITTTRVPDSLVCKEAQHRPVKPLHTWPHGSNLARSVRGQITDSGWSYPKGSIQVSVQPHPYEQYFFPKLCVFHCLFEHSETSDLSSLYLTCPVTAGLGCVFETSLKSQFNLALQTMRLNSWPC